MPDPDQEGGERPPDHLMAAVKQAFDHRLATGDVASLTFDSLVDSLDPPQAHVLHFEHVRMTIEVALSTEREGSSLAGQIAGAPARSACLHVRGSDATEVVDLVGRSFLFMEVPHGLVRLSIETDRDAVWTDWFRT